MLSCDLNDDEVVMFAFDLIDFCFNFESSDFCDFESFSFVLGLCHLLCDAKLAGQLNDLPHSEHLFFVVDYN